MPIFCYFLFFSVIFGPIGKITCMLIFSIFSYFIFIFLNFLSLFVFIFCETARTRRFSVVFAKVQWHPCKINNVDVCCRTQYRHLHTLLSRDTICRLLALPSPRTGKLPLNECLVHPNPDDVQVSMFKKRECKHKLWELKSSNWVFKFWTVHTVFLFFIW